MLAQRHMPLITTTAITAYNTITWLWVYTLRQGGQLNKAGVLFLQHCIVPLPFFYLQQKFYPWTSRYHSHFRQEFVCLVRHDEGVVAQLTTDNCVGWLSVLLSCVFVFGVWCTAYTHTIHTILLKVLSQGEVCLIEVYTHYMRHRPLSNHSKLKLPSWGILYCPENITWPQNPLGLKEQQAELFVRVFKHPGVFFGSIVKFPFSCFLLPKENSCRDSCPSHPSQRYIYTIPQTILSPPHLGTSSYGGVCSPGLQQYDFAPYCLASM